MPKPTARAPHKLPRPQGKVRRQCAAIPIRFDADGQLLVMLLTSRETGRWVIPKGWTATTLTWSEAATREAYEEAGVIGRLVGDTPIGSYRYEKRLTADRTVTCDVIVFLLEVRQQLATWPEKGQRQTQWFLPAEAATLVNEPDLAAMLRTLASLQRGEEPAIDATP